MGITAETYDELLTTGVRLRWFCDTCDKKVMSAADQNMLEIKSMFEMLMERTKKIEDALKEKADVKVVEGLEARITRLEEIGKEGTKEDVKDVVPSKAIEEAVEKVVIKHLSEDKDLDSRKRTS